MRKGHHEPVLEGDGEETHQDRLGGHQHGNVRVSEQKISMGRRGTQHTSFLEEVKRVISEAAPGNQKETVLLVIDVGRPYLYAKAKRRVYIALPERDG